MTMNLEESMNKRVREAELFTKRFGSFSKSDYEILAFTIYLDSQESNVRDYDISIALGITESKVRNLRVKSQLMYPRELDWVSELAASIEHGYYDKQQQMVTVTLEDPSVLNMIKNKIEENYGTVGRSLNAKQLILPIESFLLLAMIDEKDNESILKELNMKLNRESQCINEIEKDNLKGRFLHTVSNVTNYLSSVETVYNIGKPIVTALLQLIR